MLYASFINVYACWVFFSLNIRLLGSCVCVPMCACSHVYPLSAPTLVHECAETRGQPQVLFFRCCPLLIPIHKCIPLFCLFILRQCQGLCWTETCQLVGVTSQWAPGMHLSPPPGTGIPSSCHSAQHYNGFWGVKPGPLCSQGRCLTHWAVSKALFLQLTIYPTCPTL